MTIHCFEYGLVLVTLSIAEYRVFTLLFLMQRTLYISQKTVWLCITSVEFKYYGKPNLWPGFSLVHFSFFVFRPVKLCLCQVFMLWAQTTFSLLHLLVMGSACQFIIPLRCKSISASQLNVYPHNAMKVLRLMLLWISSRECISSFLGMHDFEVSWS